ncbi:MAG: CHAT domain-containing protein, partial [Desulfobacterales bacterium]
DSGIPLDAPFVGTIRLDLVELFAIEGAYADAAQQFDMAQACFRERQFFMGKLLFRQNVFAALIMADRSEEALPLMDEIHQNLANRLGPEHPRSILMVALRGMANDSLGKEQAAAKDYAAALPTLLSTRMMADNRIQRNWLGRVVLEAYLDHLAKAQPTSNEVIHTTFKIAEALRYRALQQAIRARSARVAITDPAIKDLTRREQDAHRQIAVLKVNLSNALAAPVDQVDPALVAQISRQLERLKAAQQTIQSEIQAATPLYGAFAEHRPMALDGVQALLKPQEALLAIYTTRRNTFIWGIPQQGAPRMAVAPTGRLALATQVDRIRLSLDAAPATLGSIPAFDLAAAHQLYRQLLVPVAAAWSAADELLVVTNAPLDRLPLGLLPVSDGAPSAPADDLLFGAYRRVDWLIRHAAISRHASVAAFAILRQTPVQAHARRPFAGFGDPVFDPDQLASPSPAEKSPPDVHIRERGLALRVRGVRVTKSGSLDDETIPSTHLRDLAPLPDTADEIRGIARALQAAPQATIFLGKDASEARLKSMHLADRQVIVFATHALVPGDLDGLHQPALALSNPDVTGESEDGLLSMGEIMTLKLDADWVVLSACNTGSGGGAGAEAISGLGQAFFYAGSRALLVSLWPVETTSARHLTTEIFRRQQANPALGRSAALQQSILALMDGPGLPDPATGKVAARYAHPFFWAPFILVGEGAVEHRPP